MLPVHTRAARPLRAIVLAGAVSVALAGCQPVEFSRTSASVDDGVVTQDGAAPTASSAPTPPSGPAATPRVAPEADGAGPDPTADPSDGADDGAGDGADDDAGDAAALPATRDKLRQPFSSDSIWNTAVGSDARYVPVDLRTGRMGADEDFFIVTGPDDPLVPTYLNPTFGPGRCAGTTPQPQAQWHPELGEPMPVPRDLVIPDAIDEPGRYYTPNNSSAFLMPDGRTLEQFNVTTRCEPGGPLYGYRVAKQDIYGDGTYGGHLGSGLSSIGGTLRLGELFDDAPLAHALKINLPGEALSYNDDGTRGFRWPAILADGGAARQYTGTEPELELGALLALPPSVTAEELGITTREGRKLFAAFRDYGAYTVDTTGTDAVDMAVEKGVPDEYTAETGEDWGSGPLADDFSAIVAALEVVDDNGPDSVGGAGSPRRPAAPPIGN